MRNILTSLAVLLF